MGLLSMIHDGRIYENRRSAGFRGIEEGLKHESSIHCDELVSLPKPVLTNFVGRLSLQKLEALNEGLGIALDIPD